MKTPEVLVKVATLMFAITLVFIAFQSYWVAQIDLPYLWRSMLAIGGGMVFGHATSVLFILWMEADNSFE